MKTLTKKMIASVLPMTATAIITTPAYAVLPVIDAANLQQTILSGTEHVAQTLKQIEQYRLQLQQYETQLQQYVQQYENMLLHTAAPVAYLWDEATATINRLRHTIDTLKAYKNKLGNLDAYLAKFKDTASYHKSPCYSLRGCTEKEWEAIWTAMQDSERLGSESQKKATDALFKGLDKQQDAMESDAKQLQRLQSAAQGARGQLQAIGFANQLASHQANQLLQVRGLLAAQQNVIATRNQALADREAKEAASSTQLRIGKYRTSTTQRW